MRLSRRAVMALEQVVTAEFFESLLFLALLAFQDTVHGALQVVVGDSPGHTAEKMEALDVPFKESFLFLEWKSHHETGFRMVQPHAQKVCLDFLTGQTYGGFSPVNLGILTGVEL